jgi:hypothetical protein
VPSDATGTGSPFRADTDAAALVDRLQKLRNLLPAFAQEAAAARREAARLRRQNTTQPLSTKGVSTHEHQHRPHCFGLTTVEGRFDRYQDDHQ